MHTYLIYSVCAWSMVRTVCAPLQDLCVCQPNPLICHTLLSVATAPAKPARKDTQRGPCAESSSNRRRTLYRRRGLRLMPLPVSALGRQHPLPAWFLDNPSVGGAVFPGRTAGNDAYHPWVGGGAVFSGRTTGNDANQPRADPPRQALSSCPAKSSRFLFLPPASRASSRSVICVPLL